MHVTEKGQVTIPKHIRVAAGIAPGSELSFSLEGSKIVITPVGTDVKDDRRAKLRPSRFTPWSPPVSQTTMAAPGRW